MAEDKFRSEGYTKDTPSIILDFAHTKFDWGIKKIYFGYYSEKRPDTYFELIKQCKFIDEITSAGKITTFVDKLGPDILGNDPAIFCTLSGSGCDTSPAPITIPNIRTQNQFGGIDSRYVYGQLIWSNSKTEIKKIIDENNNKLADILLDFRKQFIQNNVNSSTCRLCNLLTCYDFDPLSTTYPTDSNNKCLCRVCFSLNTKEQMLAKIQNYNPKSNNNY